MIDPYVKKEDILKLIEKLSKDNVYINKKELQKAILFSKEYKKPKEDKRKSTRGIIYIPYKARTMMDNIKEYRRSIKENPRMSPFYTLKLGIEPPFQLEHKGEIVNIEDFILYLKDIEKILDITKTTRVRYLNEGYIQEFDELTIKHNGKVRTIRRRFYSLGVIFENLKGMNNIIP